MEEALDDVQLCWDNCLRYNHAESVVYKQALILEDKFWTNIKASFGDMYDEIEGKIRDQNKGNKGITSTYTGNYQLPSKNK